MKNAIGMVSESSELGDKIASILPKINIKKKNGQEKKVNVRQPMTERMKREESMLSI